MPHRLASSAALAAALLAGAALASRAMALEARYEWNLAGAAGAIRTTGVALTWDWHGKELFVVDGGVVRVFSPTGMEIYRFGSDEALGRVMKVAALENGDLLLLSSFGSDISVVRTNYRGEPIGRFELAGIPAEFTEDFRPNGIAYADGKVFLVDKRLMRLVVTDLSGAHLASHDLAEMIRAQDEAEGTSRRDPMAVTRENTGIRGFGVDPSGNVLFTVQPLFRVYVLTADGRLRSFGKKGSGPGKFNVVGPIAADEKGNLYVGDLLRSVVMVFDRDFQFVREFGARGDGPGKLIVPSELAAGDGKVFVSQLAGRGVSVFSVRDAG